jgi:ABC-type transport system substrate-binding protein
MMLAEVVQGYLSEVGITLNIEAYSFPIAIQMQRNGSVDLCITSFYTMNGDISGCFIQLFEGSYNKAAWLTQLDSELADKLHEGRFNSSAEASQDAYNWVQQWLDDQMWYMPVVEYNTAFLYRDYVMADTFSNFKYARDIRNLDLNEAVNESN